MKISLVAGEPNGQACTDCAVRPLSICAALDRAELRELDHLGRHVHFGPRETVFAQEQMTTSFYNLLEGVMRLYKLLPDGRRQIVGFALPGDFLGMTTSARHSFSADAIGAVAVCRFSRTSFAQFIEDKPHLLRRMIVTASRTALALIAAEEDVPLVVAHGGILEAAAGAARSGSPAAASRASR